MPGILHQHAVKRALPILGPGAATTGMRPQIRAWLDRAALLNKESIRPTECQPEAECVDIDDDLICRKCIRRLNREDVRGWPRVLPDAFRIHRDDPRCELDERFFLVDIIEIDGSHTLRHKVDRWINFGDAVDYNDYTFLRLRIFNEHLVQIGEYTEADLFLMMIEDIVDKAKERKATPDPAWAEMVRKMRERPTHG